MSEQNGTGLEQGGPASASPSGRTIVKAEYHHGDGILPFALHPPILRFSGQSLRTCVHSPCARTQEKGNVLTYRGVVFRLTVWYTQLNKSEFKEVLLCARRRNPTELGWIPLLL